MSQQPNVYLIHADDAHPYQKKLQEILQQLREEGRIADIHALSTHSITTLKDQIQPHDLILILLTSALERSRNQVEQIARAIRTEQSHLIVAEVVVDNLPYTSEFITFPADLLPLRNREDIYAIWQDIQQKLQQMLPVQQSPSSSSTSIGTRIIIFFLTTMLVGILIPIYAHHDLYGFALIGVLILHITGLVMVFRSAQSSNRIKVFFIATLVVGIWGIFAADRDDDIILPLLVIAGINFIGLFFRKRKKENNP